MDKISGLILDVYDDKEGAIMRQVYPRCEEVPALLKHAHCITTDERSQLPDSMFALVLTQGEHRMRKFACVDSGNTALSIEYFLRTNHKLPEEAQKLAAENLVTACSWYDIDPPKELEKAAMGLVSRGLLVTGLGAPMLLPGAAKESEAQRAVNKGSIVLTPAQRKANMQRAGFTG